MTISILREPDPRWPRRANLLMPWFLHRERASRHSVTTTVVGAIAIPSPAVTNDAYSSTSKRSRWGDIDEQRLLAYKREDMSWNWIFKKFPGRTPAAIRTHWTMVQRRAK